jgi:hypothetical protein
MGPVLAVSIVVAAFAVLAGASWRWGSDTRVGRDWEWPTEDPASALLESAAGRSRRILGSTKNFLADQAELHERMALLNRPWEEQFVHWAGDPSNPRLHGSVPPPRDGRRRSVTRSGWCPGLARELHRHDRGADEARPEPFRC